MEIAEGIHRLENSFVNIYLVVEPTGLTLVDTGLTKSGSKVVLETLQTLGHRPSDLKTILITHADPDHIGGAAELKRATGAQLLASRHDGEAMGLGKPGRPPKGAVGLLMRVLPLSKITPQAPDGVVEDSQEPSWVACAFWRHLATRQVTCRCIHLRGVSFSRGTRCALQRRDSSLAKGLLPGIISRA
jgi:glyoxylase-like metal-dependent hydrolase (beta-lactamase superfamily II)